MPDKDFTDAILDMAKGSPTTARELALVLAEREACAKIADEWRSDRTDTYGEDCIAEGIATAIRARNKEG